MRLRTRIAKLERVAPRPEKTWVIVHRVVSRDLNALLVESLDFAFVRHGGDGPALRLRREPGETEAAFLARIDEAAHPASNPPITTKETTP